MRNVVTLVDLDDTLFQTLRKCSPQIDHDRLTPYAYGVDGLPISYATPTQLALIRWLEATTTLIVVTARSSPALFRSKVNFQQAIAAHGGIIIDNTEPTQPSISADWQAMMQGQLSQYEPTLQDLKNEIESDAAAMNALVRARIIYEQCIPLYLVIKSGEEPANDERLHEACSKVTSRIPANWTVHINGNNVAYLPPGLGKEHAVKWLMPKLRANYPDSPIIGIGDSHSDGPFMQLCDFAMTPAQSQLASRLFHSRDRNLPSSRRLVEAARSSLGQAL